MKKITVLMGGTSSEREVSLKSGEAVAGALVQGGCEVVSLVLERDALDALPPGTDAVFIALHGGYGENGGVQADLDALKVPYTGPGAAASRLAMDKIATKRILEREGIPTAPWEILREGAALRSLAPPLIVKPPREGSSVGITRVLDATALAGAVARACAADPLGQALAERYIAGREWTVGILGEETLPPVEILAPDGWYGFEEKYTKGLSGFAFPDPAEEGALIDSVRRCALHAHKALGCRGVSRVDFRVDAQGRPFVLEVNTVPGMTSTSLLPRAAERAGINFCNLCLKLVEFAAFD
jgi:D-alanine-D-alanine ligase